MFATVCKMCCVNFTILHLQLHMCTTYTRIHAQHAQHAPYIHNIHIHTQPNIHVEEIHVPYMYDIHIHT